MRKRFLCPAVPGALMVLCAATAAMAVPDGSSPSIPSSSARGGPPPLMALGGLEPGLWELRERDAPSKNGVPALRLCVRHPAQLLQIRHRGAQCGYYVVADNPSRAVITYQCERSGTGYTDLRMETSRLVQIQTQGVENGAPFALTLEGRRIGECRP